MPEPGYYFGAMFVSYALNTILFVAIWLLLTVLFSDVSVTLVLVVLIAALFAFLPVTFRLSRVLWIYIFVRPDKTR
jgi:glycerol-3-phosphate acyltransferase PlsY